MTDILSEPEGIPFECSLVTAVKPNILSKIIRLVDGTLQKFPGGQLIDGTVEVLSFSSIEAFADLLPNLKHNQALVFGLLKDGLLKARIAVKNALDQARQRYPDETVISRTRECFEFSDGSGIMMLDYDPEKGKTALTRDQLLEALYKGL